MAVICVSDVKGTFHNEYHQTCMISVFFPRKTGGTEGEPLLKCIIEPNKSGTKPTLKKNKNANYLNIINNILEEGKILIT